MDDLFGLTEAVLHTRVRRLRDRYPGKITVEELRSVVVASGGKCCWCEKGVRGSDLTIEHLRADNNPLSLAVACFSCNSAHKTGHKKKSDVPAEIVDHRRTARLKHWEKENEEATKAIKAASYQRNKETAKRYREQNRERIRAEKKRYREEKKEKIVAYDKQYRVEKKEQVAAQRKAWRAAHPDEVKKRWDDFYSNEENAAKVKAAVRARRAKTKELC